MDDGQAVLVDAGPDIRAQSLAFGVRRVDAIVFTHGHADHIMGLDDIRRFNVLQQRPMPCYGDAATIDDLRRIFFYVFDPARRDGRRAPADRAVPYRRARSASAGRRSCRFRILHGKRPILGLRIGTFAYLTDCSRIPDESWPLLDGLDLLVLDALRERPHPTHFSLAEAIEVSSRIGAAPDLLHAHVPRSSARRDVRAAADGVELAYDGLVVEGLRSPNAI